MGDPGEMLKQTQNRGRKFVCKIGLAGWRKGHPQCAKVPTSKVWRDGPYFQKSLVFIGECILGFVKIVYSLNIL